MASFLFISKTANSILVLDKFDCKFLYFSMGRDFIDGIYKDV